MTIKRGSLHQFMADRRSLRQMFRSLWALNAGFGVLLIAGAVVVFMQWRANLGVVEQRSALILLGLVVLVLMMLNAMKSAAAAWVTSADLEAGSDGVYVYLQEGKPALIRWDRLKGAAIRKVQMPLLFPSKGSSEAYTIHAPELGILYRLTGIEYGQGWQPVFVVTSAHENHQKLIEQIEQASQS